MMIVATMAQPLPGVLHDVEPVLNQYGYLAVCVLVLVESFGVPVPGETVLVVGAIYAGAGRLNILLVALVGLLAAVIGDNIGFAVGHFGGRRLVERFGRYVLLTPRRLADATRFFERHGGKIVIFARFVEGLRQANGIVAGTAGMRWERFLIFNVIGAALWVAVWAAVGYFSGSHINAIYGAVTRYQLYVLIGCGGALACYIAWLIYRRTKKPPSQRPPAS